MDAIFQAQFILTDLRVLMRETAPLHEMDDDQKARAVKLIEKAKRQIAILEEEMV